MESVTTVLLAEARMEVRGKWKGRKKKRKNKGILDDNFFFLVGGSHYVGMHNTPHGGSHS